MFLTDRDVAELTEWRHELHRAPELSGQEAETARKVAAFLAATSADRIETSIGGHGVAAVYQGAEPGPTVMFRAELDGLPIDEISDAPYRSTVPGKGHLCGHDGHMATLAALARGLGRQRPARGRAVLLFQPAEENGAGAAAVLADPKFQSLSPDYAFALHNLPGLPLGHVALDEGPVNCASRGMRIALTGKTAHASTPEHGASPMPAVAALMPALTALGPGGSVGRGIHAGDGDPCQDGRAGLRDRPRPCRGMGDAAHAHRCRYGAAQRAGGSLAHRAAREARLGIDITYQDVFAHCANASRGRCPSAPRAGR